jgi:adenine-specific DNA-methyltransferase
MQKYEPIKLDKETTDGTVRNLDALYQLFPSCFTEAQDALGKVHRAVDWGKLRSLLGEYVEDGEPEKYDFTWVGKRAAQREAAAPCRKTLRPCKEESVDWDTTQNLYIEGDNLEVLKLLQNSYMGKVKMIYIDPPYNTGNDFVYHDDFAQSAEEYDEHNLDDEGNRFRKNTDSNGRFHSDWCSMIYARLMVARSLLTEDGVIFISIDDNEVENLKKISNEVFGESNFVACFKWNRVAKAPSLSGMVRTKYEYILSYHKGVQPSLFGKASYNTQGPLWHLPNKRAELVFPANSIRIPNSFQAGYYGGTYQVELLNDMNELNGLNANDVRILACSAWGQEKINTYIGEGKTFQIKKSPITVYTDLDSSNNYIAPSDLIDDAECNVKRNTDAKEELRKMEIPFDYSKPVSLPQYLCKTVTYDNKDAIIIDFFSGSATTAHAVMQLNAEDGGNRKFIMVQLPEETVKDSEAYKAGYKNICEIGKERIRRAGRKIKADSPLTTKDLDIGFRVLKCDESNYKPVAFAPKDYTQESLDMFLDNIKEERTGLDLLFDCMMRWGLELSLPYETQKVDGCTIYNVDDGSLVACFDGVVTSAVIDAIADTHPLRVVFRDSSFTEAAQKMNLFELFKQKCGWTDQEVQNNVRVI